MNDIDEYIRLADSWGRAIESGDSDTANSLYDRIQKLFRYLCQTRNENDLFDRAETASDAACFFIASHIKESDQQRANRLCERLTHSSLPFLAMSAKHIVNEMSTNGD